MLTEAPVVAKFAICGVKDVMVSSTKKILVPTMFPVIPKAGIEKLVMSLEEEGVVGVEGVVELCPIEKPALE